VGRLGGDEFALLLPGSDEAKAVAVANRIAKAFELPLRLDDQTVDLSAAFGVACWPAHGASSGVLLSRAEIAMHEAKRRTELLMIYETAMDPDSTTTLSLLSELRRAVERDELRLFVQPKFSLDGRLVGGEALLRWQHPVRGMVPPLAFIPFAEKTGYVRQLTAWVFDDAARQWPLLAAAGLQRLSVNLGVHDLMDLGLPARLDATLARRGVPASAFCLEITESAIMVDPARALQTLQLLRERGFKLSIDDFGEGYTSLKYLRQLPIDELKVDGIFVKQMDQVPQDEAVVRSVVELAHNLGFSVVAEGVENAEVWHRLAAMGCDEAQGFFMCRPLPADELPAFGRRWAAGEVARVAAPAAVTAAVAKALGA
jgi:EAL domain-containing protein (putative c-di-GMP-specific phosphodiesterase class I)